MGATRSKSWTVSGENVAEVVRNGTSGEESGLATRFAPDPLTSSAEGDQSPQEELVSRRAAPDRTAGREILRGNASTPRAKANELAAIGGRAAEDPTPGGGRAHQPRPTGRARETPEGAR